MKDTGSIHKKVQELCDCYATNDPLKEMSKVKTDADKDEAAAKWLALAALHGVNNNARKISVQRGDDGKVTVTAEYNTAELPSPGEAVADRIFQAVRNMTHIDGEKGQTAFALGIRDSSLDLKIKVKTKSGNERVSIEFP